MSLENFIVGVKKAKFCSLKRSTMTGLLEKGSKSMIILLNLSVSYHFYSHFYVKLSFDHLILVYGLCGVVASSPVWIY